CSYGPGRYDTSYELKGRDYPFGYVRWTEQRNFGAILDLINQGTLNVDELVTERFEFDRALEAYRRLTTDSSAVGFVLSYDGSEFQSEGSDQTVRLGEPARVSPRLGVSVGMIGSGQHVSQTLLPLLAKTGVRIKSIASKSGVSSTRLAKRYHIEESTTNVDSIMNDPEINTIFIATRHDTHAGFVIEALKGGKNVFVEKPLAISPEELAEIEGGYEEGDSPVIMVGFNRRFAPQVVKMKELIGSLSEPKSFVFTVNAGAVPQDHWVMDPKIGGGRIIGEGCHFVDLLRFLAGARIVDVQSTQMGLNGGARHPEDRVSFTLKFEDGSFGTVHYLANGSRRFPKERLEVFCGGRILQLNNFRRLRGFGWPGFSRMNLRSQDKGHRGCIRAFIQAVEKNGPSPIPFEELLEVSGTTFEIVEKAG
ncbi:MAG: Gfo/Idh/MocA family oxidoreductase, partial [Fidelibacterota bacterium]